MLIQGRLLSVAATLLCALCVAGHAEDTMSGAKLSVERDLPQLDRANAWLNTPPLSVPDLRGKVVLVQFWTYTCINWRRTLPYVRAWATKYADQGLVVIGVHTPEFSFEKDVGNVRRAVSEQRIPYAVAVDSDYAVWRAFDNHYWPALYFVDARGRIRHHHFGEGEYERSEQIIQLLLVEAEHAVSDRTLVSVDASGTEVAADWQSLRSPETYLGYERTNNFASHDGVVRDRSRVYSAPERLRPNEWALAGNWTMRSEFADLNKANGKVAYRFHARDLHLIMGPAEQGSAARFRVLIDGEPPRSAHGEDTDEQGNGVVAEPRMYHLIRQTQPISDRRFEIEFLDPGVRVFCFTFG